jgi:hypothetical protein
VRNAPPIAYHGSGLPQTGDDQSAVHLRQGRGSSRRTRRRSAARHRERYR